MDYLTVSNLDPSHLRSKPWTRIFQVFMKRLHILNKLIPHPFKLT